MGRYLGDRIVCLFLPEALNGEMCRDLLENTVVPVLTKILGDRYITKR